MYFVRKNDVLLYLTGHVVPRQLSDKQKNIIEQFKSKLIKITSGYAVMRQFVEVLSMSLLQGLCLSNGLCIKHGDFAVVVVVESKDSYDHL